MLPSGSQAIDGLLGYSAHPRHQMKGYLITSDAAEQIEVRKRRALNDTRAITADDKWAQVARVLKFPTPKGQRALHVRSCRQPAAGAPSGPSMACCRPTWHGRTAARIPAVMKSLRPRGASWALVTDSVHLSRIAHQAARAIQRGYEGPWPLPLRRHL